jgi:hypothetical protein
MTSNSPIGSHESVKAKRTRVAKPQTQPNHGYSSIDIERSRDWMPAEELLEAAQATLGNL